MENFQAGMLALSRAGHDKDRLYVIIKTDGEYVYLSDGKIRTIDNPKRKKRKHIQIIRKIDAGYLNILETGQTIRNEDIIRILKQNKAYVQV